jgi:hypothetical protein
VSPLAAIYHPGGPDPTGYPVAIVDFIASWSEELGAITQAVCVTTDGAIRVVDTENVQVVDRGVAEAIVGATEAYDRQRQQQGTVPPSG